MPGCVSARVRNGLGRHLLPEAVVFTHPAPAHPRVYSSLENTAAPYSITLLYHGRRWNSASVISCDRVRSSTAKGTYLAPSERGKNCGVVGGRLGGKK